MVIIRFQTLMFFPSILGKTLVAVHCFFILSHFRKTLEKKKKKKKRKFELTTKKLNIVCSFFFSFVDKTHFKSAFIDNREIYQKRKKMYNKKVKHSV